MNGTLVFFDGTFQSLRKRLFVSELETCAVLLATPVRLGENSKYIVKNEIYFSEADYAERSAMSASLRSEVVFGVASRAKRQDQTLIFVHTHPSMDGFPIFSSIDDRGEGALAPFLAQYLPNQTALSLILSKDGCSARTVPTGKLLRVIEVNRSFAFLSRINAGGADFERTDRQIRAFGKSIMPVLENLRVGVIGLGGTGSLTTQQLAYLGVQDFVLMDDDIVELTNLNRVVGATHSDINRFKTDVASDLVARIAPNAKVQNLQESVLEDASARKLLDRDLLFCCTDSHGSRAVLNQLAYQYAIPCIDMGISITTKEGKITHIVGRVQFLGPSLGCLTCGGLLDAGEVRIDLMTEHQRRRDPYFLGQAEPQPSVISLNSTVSSLAVTMFLGVVTQAPLAARFLRYDALSGTVRSVEHLPRPGCVVCSASGALARGDTWPLPARR